MTPLTTEQVARLRLPEGIELKNISSTRNPCWYWSATNGKDAEPSFDTAQRHLATIAGWVANGDLPPEALDAVWAIVEGDWSYRRENRRGEFETCEKGQADYLVLVLPS
jgi:hypothetical protein